MRPSRVAPTWPAAACATIANTEGSEAPPCFCIAVPLVHHGWVKQSQPIKTPGATGFGIRKRLLWSLTLHLGKGCHDIECMWSILLL
ncbi:uncharacterized protein N7525_004811 [Penicillium rubens]|uniref:uncharacterized protein n=1 Tax=Penicillium rubens TaxID=1108849 RepID=UPI002A5A2F2F|nr:uncharacterized protein N7525_004811 [Penicillium rubens]KAJ5839623.1 hypothetical protein N7525_004811 [Penicillium rubens]KAJ5867619.1 hypothetical protein N7534_002172 [Penicillium rubens]